jgi:hypothetical protein
MVVRIHNFNLSVQTSSSESLTVDLHLNGAILLFCSIELLNYVAFMNKLIV